MSAPLVEIVPFPAAGRRFVRERPVRLGDAGPDGRLRLDAVARYLQDIADDDSVDAGYRRGEPWVVRRTAIRVRRAPRFGDRIELATTCSGMGARWAERRTDLRGADEVRVEVASLWVHLDDAGRPAPLPPGFEAHWGAAAGGRTVRGRLIHPPPPEAADERPWALRWSDLDVLGHVNNAAYWEAAEELRAGRRVAVAEIEHREPVDRGASLTLRTATAPDGERAWLVADGRVAASIRLVLSGP